MKNSLSISEAQEALKNGSKITHRFYSDGEWIQMDKKGNLIDQNGHLYDFQSYWKYLDHNYDIGWYSI